MKVLYTVLCANSYDTYKDNLSNNQELLKFVILSSVPMTLMFDSGVILLTPLSDQDIISPYSINTISTR